MPHPTPSSPVAAARERHASPPSFVCTDAASLLGLVERVAVSEQERVLQLLGADYCERFNTVGFCGPQGRPVQIMSPYILAPGPERRAFLEALAERQAKGTVDTMPYLVYWFDASLVADTPKITLEPRDSILSYEQGEAQGYDTLPKPITKKMAKKETLTKEEQLLCDALGAMEIANDSGAAAVAVPPPDHVLYKVVLCEPSQPLPEFPTPRSMEKKKQTAANALLEMGAAQHDEAAEGLPQLGDRVRVFWEGENEWYYGTVEQIRQSFYFIHYDDDEDQWLPLAEHVFAVVPAGENGEATPETESKDASWSSSPRRTPRSVPARKCKTESAKTNKKKQRSKRAADDGETEWNDTELTEKPKKKKKQQQASKSPAKKKKKKEAAPKSSPTKTGSTVFRDGFLYPIKAPNQDDKGFFKRPAGRDPSGFTWDRRNARFKPTSEPLVGNKKRKEDAYEDHAFEKLPSKNAGKAKKQRRVKEPVASDDDDSWLGETATTTKGNRCKEEEDAKEQPLKIPRRKSPPPEAGQTSAEKGPTDAAVAKPKLEVAEGVKSENSNQENDSSNSNSPEAAERDAKKLQRLLPLSKDADAVEVEQVRAVLLSLNRAKASVPRDITQSLYKPVRKLRKHPHLGELACSLIKKYRDAALGEMINDWSQAVAEKDTEGAKQKIQDLYVSLTVGKTPLDLDPALVERHNLRDLVLVTSMFFADEGVSLSELTTLEGLLGESDQLEDTAEV